MPLIFLLVFLFSIAIAPAAFAAGGELEQDSEGYYLIEDAADLAAFRDIVNGIGDYEGRQNAGAHAKLTADIDLESESWTPIANYSDSNTSLIYTGTFDGGGYAIYGLTVSVSEDYAGFFGYVGTDGVVKNLTIASGSVSGSGNYVGGIVGYNSGTVQNCANSAAVSITQNTCVGGIVGKNFGTVQNCTNLGTVSKSTYYGVASIVGENRGTVKNCGYLEGSYDYAINATYGNASQSNIGSFSPDEMYQIAVTLSASIADSATAANGETTITLTTQPGTASTVMSAGGLEISASDSKGLVTVTNNNNNDGTLTVRANGNGTGETVITVKAALYTYNYSSGEYDTDPDTATTYEFTFDLTVGDVPIEGITLSEPSLDMTVGDTHTLTVSYTPDNTTQREVAWESSDTNIATVDENGKVTGVSVGTAWITAIATENEDISASCEITVAEAPETPDDEETGDEESGGASGGSSGGGCNAGTGALALLALIPLALRRKR